MNSPNPLVRVLLRGGVVSPADLLQVADMAARVGSEFLYPGVRQDILFPVAGTSPDAVVEHLGRAGLSSAVVDTSSDLFRGGANNVASSYLAVNVVETTWWLRETVYQKVLDAFATDPRLRVNLVDPFQAIVPLFHGDLNFVASPEEHYWHLYLRLPDMGEELLPAPVAVHTGDLIRVVRAIEERWHGGGEEQTNDPVGWEMFLRGLGGGSQTPPPDACSFTLPTLPFLEGFHAMASGQFWLGLYRREGRFPADFIRDLSSVCQETLVGKVAITPWKSLLLKGIRGRALPRWEELMAEHGINVRHSSLELNWHIPVLDGDALAAKRRIVAELDRRDASLNGMTVTLTSSPREPYFTDTVIEQVPEMVGNGGRYDLRIADRTVRDTFTYRTVASRAAEEDLPDLLIGLAQRRAGGEAAPNSVQTPPPRSDSAAGGTELPAPALERWIGYQCSSCLTVYEERYGAPESGVDPGTPFTDLSPEWSCSLCGAGLEAFAPVESLI